MAFLTLWTAACIGMAGNPEFVEKLRGVSFVMTAAGHTARPAELFHPQHPIFSRVFQNQPVFPAGEFREPEWLGER